MAGPVRFIETRDARILRQLGPLWHAALVRRVEQSLLAWFVGGDSAMWQKQTPYDMHVQALDVLTANSSNWLECSLPHCSCKAEDSASKYR